MENQFLPCKQAQLNLERNKKQGAMCCCASEHIHTSCLLYKTSTFNEGNLFP